MPRRIMLETGNNNVEILEEGPADNEKQLQELVKDNFPTCFRWKTCE